MGWFCARSTSHSGRVRFDWRWMVSTWITRKDLSALYNFSHKSITCNSFRLFKWPSTLNCALWPRFSLSGIFCFVFVSAFGFRQGKNQGGNQPLHARRQTPNEQDCTSLSWFLLNFDDFSKTRIIFHGHLVYPQTNKIYCRLFKWRRVSTGRRNTKALPLESLVLSRFTEIPKQSFWTCCWTKKMR